ncbi:Telomerase-binding EST1A [Fusarium albosuccineum]|uniref:Telomerase-binding EST1A n=1 Tax=Fusarium albosuccineum TaxID=1237068 RepID=A0A8H4LBW6_9HYPO|nr:Telomerase-binding EST1A [Fusarium albosuccineum]
MAGITDPRVGYLRNRERQDKAEPNTFLCPICRSEIETLETWRTHVEEDSKHRERWQTKQAMEDAYKEYGYQSNEPGASSSPKSRKRHAGDPTSSPTRAEDGEGETREAKRRSPPPPGFQQPATSQAPLDEDDYTSKMMRQPDTRPISQAQLVAEVKRIHAGLVMVETKCIEVDNAQSSNTDANSKLNNEQWQALIALHRTLLHEHHDFFLASQHPSTSPTLRRLASIAEPELSLRC